MMSGFSKSLSTTEHSEQSITEKVTSFFDRAKARVVDALEANKCRVLNELREVCGDRRLELESQRSLVSSRHFSIIAHRLEALRLLELADEGCSHVSGCASSFSLFVIVQTC